MPCYSSMIFGIYMDYIWGFIIVRYPVLITEISMRFGFPSGSPSFIIQQTACVCVCALRHLVEVWARLIAVVSGMS